MAARTQAALVFMLVLGPLACPGEPGPKDDPQPAVPLANADGWARVIDTSVDVFADERPADATCDDIGWFYDPFLNTIEVETEICNYLTLRQSALEPLNPGDVVTIRAYHDVLTAPDPGEGYLGLAIGGEREWEFNVAIPTAGADVEATFTIDRSLPIGAEIQFHVHNHGANSWELRELLVTPAQ